MDLELTFLSSGKGAFIILNVGQSVARSVTRSVPRSARGMLLCLLLSLFFSVVLCLSFGLSFSVSIAEKKLRPESKNMVRQCGSESHNHPPPIPYGLVVFA